MNFSLNLFPNEAAERAAKALAEHKHLWKICWDWTPQVGRPASFSCVCATDGDGCAHYVYMARNTILELTETDCLVEYVSTLTEATGDLHGLRFRLPLTDLWPVTFPEHVR